MQRAQVTYGDSHNEIIRLNPDLTEVQSIKINEKSGLSEFSGVAVIGDEVIVFDNASKSMKVFTKELEFVKPIAVPNDGTIRDMSSDKDGNLYVSDYSHGNVRVFNVNDAVNVRSFSGTVYPYGLCVSGEYVYMTNSNNHNIPVYNAATNKSVTTLSLSGSSPDAISSPRGMCVDADGFLYVCDRGNNRIQVF